MPAQVVPGLVTALKAMTVGEERRIWVPAELAFPATITIERHRKWT